VSRVGQVTAYRRRPGRPFGAGGPRRGSFHPHSGIGLRASGGFLVASFVTHHTAGFESLADSLAGVYLWNFALAMALYALLAVLLVVRGVAGLITPRRGVQP
jgi:hypothetical protein